MKEYKSSYNKLLINTSLLNKINYLCMKFPKNEWAGTLFYNIHGEFLTESFSIECVDFYLQDIGVSTYTEFEQDATLMEYMGKNNLFEHKTGLIHSHNEMSCFFSGTDTSTLDECGKTFTHFLSLIVNNKGEYKARITFKSLSEKIQSYNKVIEIPNVDNLYYIDLDIEMKSDSDLDKRIELLVNSNTSVINHRISTLTKPINNNIPVYNWKDVSSYEESELNFDSTVSVDLISPFAFLYKWFTGDYKTSIDEIENNKKKYANLLYKNQDCINLNNKKVLTDMFEYRLGQLYEKYLTTFNIDEEKEFFIKVNSELTYHVSEITDCVVAGIISDCINDNYINDIQNEKNS